jgi:large subunit ribosomal protein L19
MDQQIVDFNKSLQKNNLPKVKVGDIVRVHRKIKEGEKERIQVFKGLVIAVKGKQSSSPTITVRRVSGGVGIEMIFPIFSPVVQKIEILRHSKVRRSKLYYMRERFGKAAKMKAIEVEEEELINDQQKNTDDKDGNKKDDASTKVPNNTKKETITEKAENKNNEDKQGGKKKAEEKEENKEEKEKK